MEVVFGIAHFNRFGLLNLCLDFFENLDFQKVGITVKINLYDDVSNKVEYDDFIKTNRHKFHRVIRNEQNKGSTGNIYNMYIDFLENETARFFFNLDSDLVVSESFPRVLINFLECEIGHISFYNSSSHGRKTIILIPYRAFKDSFISKRGYLDFFTGFFLSLFWAWYETMSNISLYYYQRKLKSKKLS